MKARLRDVTMDLLSLNWLEEGRDIVHVIFFGIMFAESMLHVCGNSTYVGG